MRVLVSGSSGLVGSAFVPALERAGHQAIRLVRASATTAERTIRWDPLSGTIEPRALEGIAAVVHLAGEHIVGRWTPKKKAAIRESRVQGTARLVEALTKLATPPTVLVCASAIGYYGDRGEERLTEASPAGRGFLAEVCRAWEAAAAPAAQRGIRLVSLRIGIVLSRQGGALAKMLPPFQLGLGGPLGRGAHYWSWVAIDDVVGAIQHALATEALRGPVNVVAPTPLTNAAFTKILGQVLGRPTIVPVPPFLLRLLMGEMADALLLASCRVEPTRLVESGYHFRFSELDAALRDQLRR